MPPPNTAEIPLANPIFDSSLSFLLILIMAYLFFRFFQNWRPQPWPSSHFKLPLWQVHRGFWVDGIQENTLEAFREAARRGYSMVELDVQLSSDGVPVVFHDEDLQRLARRPDRISDLDARTLKQWAHAPTLEDVLRDPQSVPYFNIEIKSRSKGTQTTALAVAKIVKATGSQTRVIFSSFNPLALRALAKELPEVPRALLATDDPSEPDNALYLRKLWLGGWAKAHMVNLDKKMITTKLMKRLDERKIPVAVWTVNEKDVADLLFNKGVVSIITDRPPVLFEPSKGST